MHMMMTKNLNKTITFIFTSRLCPLIRTMWYGWKIQNYFNSEYLVKSEYWYSNFKVKDVSLLPYASIWHILTWPCVIPSDALHAIPRMVKAWPMLPLIRWWSSRVWLGSLHHPGKKILPVVYLPCWGNILLNRLWLNFHFRDNYFLKCSGLLQVPGNVMHWELSNIVFKYFILKSCSVILNVY